MPLNPDFIGKTYPDTPPYARSAERSCASSRPPSGTPRRSSRPGRLRALGYSGLPAPPTFAFALTMKAMAAAMFDPELGLNYALVVHGEQTFEYQRPLQAGDEVVVKSFIAGHRQPGSQQVLVSQADVVTLDGSWSSPTAASS